ncbi:MAG: PTS sugar transporter subunit IIA [Phycisphaeraceae bacterium]|nr:PTS sugar transporter subunit IIA [Phycisphaeraceae bacterium]
MRLEEFCKPELALILSGVRSRDEALERIAQAAAPMIPGADAKGLLHSLIDREQKTPTSTPEGVAFPHALLPGLEQTIVVVAIARPAISFGVPGHPGSDVIFAMFGPEERPWDHVRLLARIARVARGSGALERFRKAANAESLFAALLAEDRSHV